MTRRRLQWFKKRPKDSPSDLGTMKSVTKAQVREDPTFHFNRPPSAAPTIPITLYQPILGQFKVDCEELEPAPKDHKFALDLSRAMSDFYHNEKARLKVFREILAKNDISLKTGKINSYETDGDIRGDNIAYTILEGKVELGSGGVDPLFQAGWYYTSFVGEKMNNYPESNFPCLIIYLAGILDRILTGF